MTCNETAYYQQYVLHETIIVLTRQWMFDHTGGIPCLTRGMLIVTQEQCLQGGQGPRKSLTFLGSKFYICKPSSLYCVKYAAFEDNFLLWVRIFHLFIGFYLCIKYIIIWNQQHSCWKFFQTFLTSWNLPLTWVLTMFGLCPHH